MNCSRDFSCRPDQGDIQDVDLSSPGSRMFRSNVDGAEFSLVVVLFLSVGFHAKANG